MTMIYNVIKAPFFLGAVEEQEILDIVNKCKNKTYTDWNDIDMTIVKKAIHGIVKPLTHIIYHF